MDTLSCNELTLTGEAQINGKAPNRSGVFTTKDLKIETTFLHQACKLNDVINVTVTKETTDSKYISTIEWKEK
jgi:hypothetical protein